MSDILRQVDEDLRKDRLKSFWRKYGLYIILSISASLIIIIFLQFYNASNKSKYEKIVEEYLKVSYIENFTSKLEILDEITNSDSDFIAAIAHLKMSQLLIDTGETEKGLLNLEEITKNDNYEIIIKDLALYLLLLNKISELNEIEINNYLPQTQIGSSSFKFLFMELVAIHSLISGELNSSKQEFEDLLGYPDLPQSIRARANKFLDLIG